MPTLAKAPRGLIAALILAIPILAIPILAIPGAGARAQSLPAGGADGLSLGPAIPSLSPSVAAGHGAGTGKPAAKKPAAPGPYATPPALDLGAAPEHYQPGESVANPSDPVVASVDGMRVRLSDVGAFIKTLSPSERAIPYDELFPRAVNTLIGRLALVAEAYRLGLDKTPAVERQIREATDLALQAATLTHEITPLITEREIHARYLRDIAGRPGPLEIDLGVITVATKEDAAAMIARLQGGADFATLARQDSRDPSAFKGGDLGWLRKEQMQPDIAAAALALQAGQVWPYPMQAGGAGAGWNVIKVIGRRHAPPPSFAEAHDALRDQIIVEGVARITAEAIAQASVQRFNMNGKPAQTLGPDGRPVEGSR